MATKIKRIKNKVNNLYLNKVNNLYLKESDYEKIGLFLYPQNFKLTFSV